MTLRNETLRKKLEAKRDFLVNKITPLHDELAMINAMIEQLDKFAQAFVETAKQKLSLEKGEE